MNIEKRLPPNQQLAATGKWPVVGEKEPGKSESPWGLKIDGLVQLPVSWTLEELLDLPMQDLIADLHCVTRWSQYDLKFRGIPLLELLKAAQPLDSAQYAIFHARSSRNHTTSLPLNDIRDLQPWVVFYHQGQPIESKHGGPIRLLVEGRYLYKSLKWMERIEIVASDQLGYWEGEAGYHNHGDPWLEERYFLPGLNHAELKQAMEMRNLSRGVFSGLVAEGMNLNNLVAEGAILRNANFNRCQLRDSVFEEANLSNASFHGADLSGVNFKSADLEGVDFRGSNLQGADLSFASVIAATFISEPGIKEENKWPPASIDSSTKLPDLADLEEQLTPTQFQFLKSIQ